SCATAGPTPNDPIASRTPDETAPSSKCLAGKARRRAPSGQHFLEVFTTQPNGERPHVTAAADANPPSPLCGRQHQSLSSRRNTPPDACARDRCWWQISWLAGRCFRPPSQEFAFPVV